MGIGEWLRSKEIKNGLRDSKGNWHVYHTKYPALGSGKDEAWAFNILMFLCDPYHSIAWSERFNKIIGFVRESVLEKQKEGWCEEAIDAYAYDVLMDHMISQIHSSFDCISDLTLPIFRSKTIRPNVFNSKTSKYFKENPVLFADALPELFTEIVQALRAEGYLRLAAELGNVTIAYWDGCSNSLDLYVGDPKTRHCSLSNVACLGARARDCYDDDLILDLRVGTVTIGCNAYPERPIGSIEIKDHPYIRYFIQDVEKCCSRV